MVEGGLDGGFCNLHTARPLTPSDDGARDYALVRAAQYCEMVAENSIHFELAFAPANAASIAAKKTNSLKA
jgi:hypothetical protein